MANRDDGLSPRVRGSHVVHAPPKHHDRSIPASAGQPKRRGWPSAEYRVYPRECGAAYNIVLVVKPDGGLSPRVRGSHSDGHHKARRWEVYPRECGAATLTLAEPLSQDGLSPRVRGSP